MVYFMTKIITLLDIINWDGIGGSFCGVWRITQNQYNSIVQDITEE